MTKLINDICEDSYCVYKHTNIINGKVYIGITCQDPKVRWNGGYGYRKNEYFWRAIQKYGWNTGFLHDILYEGLTHENACEIEVELISEYNSTDSRYGYNHHIGGRYQDYNTRQKISENSSSKRAVLQYSKDGDLLAEYDSKSSVSKITGISAQEIWSACSGKIFSAGGYLWCNKDDTDKIKLDLEKYRANMSHVLQFDLRGNFICEYKHVYDAAENTGINYHEIWKTCFEKIEPLNGFLFCYKDKVHRIQKWIKQNEMNKNINVKKRHAGKRKPV